MRRLIDIEDLRGCVIIRPQKHSELELIKQFSDIVSHDDIPTAYNVEKVLEEIEKESYHYDDLGGRYMIDCEKAIDIVKAGGVNG